MCDFSFFKFFSKFIYCSVPRNKLQLRLSLLKLLNMLLAASRRSCHLVWRNLKLGTETFALNIGNHSSIEILAAALTPENWCKFLMKIVIFEELN